jgi:hypothetical protein
MLVLEIGAAISNGEGTGVLHRAVDILRSYPRWGAAKVEKLGDRSEEMRIFNIRLFFVISA